MTTATAEEILPSGGESGAPPNGRPFRPDVEGLRAVAVLAVVFFHAGLPGFGGGFVGVDVFFVISGFVITGVLLRARDRGEGTSLLDFYARRARRILPASSLVLLAVVVGTVIVLGSAFEVGVATDARWTAVFLANFHFAADGTNYLSAQSPPSPLQNYWSLAVEEQFYVVYPALFWLVASWRARWSLNVRLALTLSIVIVASFIGSVVQTASSPTVAYFSPFTRAWELALGALVAVATPWLVRLSTKQAWCVGWIGICAIALAIAAYSVSTPYPGAYVALPVVGTALVIAAGSQVLRTGPELALGHPVAQWLGRRSYSWYLWHWPILVIVADWEGTFTLSWAQGLFWVLVALAVAMATYRWIENPIRHAPKLRASRGASLGLGGLLIAISLLVASLVIWEHPAAPVSPIPSASVTPATKAGLSAALRGIERTIRASTSVTRVPPDLTPSLAVVHYDLPWPSPPCFPGYGAFPPSSCIFGAVHGDHTMVLLGDSHAAMWFQPLDAIAKASHWRLIMMAKGDCPAVDLAVANPPGWGRANQTFAACAAWHRVALARIRALRPDLVVISQEVDLAPGGASYSTSQWKSSMAGLLRSLADVGAKAVVFGNLPSPATASGGASEAQVLAGPICVARHRQDVQHCALRVRTLARYRTAEQEAARVAGVPYISMIPYFCSGPTCSPVIGKYQVYWDPYHVTATYARYLTLPLAVALDLNARG